MSAPANRHASPPIYDRLGPGIILIVEYELYGKFETAEEDMTECRCPSCSRLFVAASSDFGDETGCLSCGHKFVLDIDRLACFEFPSEIVVQLADSLGKPVQIPGCKVQAKRGFPLGDVWTDDEGTARITRDHYERSRMEWTSWLIMDHPGDYSLVRYVTIWVEGPQPFGPEQLDLEHSGANPVMMLKEKL